MDTISNSKSIICEPNFLTSIMNIPTMCTNPTYNNLFAIQVELVVPSIDSISSVNIEITFFNHVFRCETVTTF